MGRQLRPRSMQLTVALPPICHEVYCNRAPDYVVTTAGGPALFCERHATFYLERGPDIYPTERFRRAPR